MKAVIDTNIFMASLINRSGAPAKIRQYWLAGKFLLVTSESIEFEYADVLLHSPKVQPEDVRVLMEEIRALSLVVPITHTLRVCKDPDDDKFLETAVKGEDRFSGNQKSQTFPQEILSRGRDR